MEEKNLTRDYIFEAFFRLLETKPYEKISVSHITDKAGVSRMSFYRNFKSKEDLVKKSLELIVAHLQNLINNLIEKNEYTIIKSFFITFKEYKSLLMALSNSPISRSLTELTMKNLKENFPSDTFNKTQKYFPIFHYSAIVSVMFEWLKNGCEESPEEMSRFLCSLTSFDIYEQFNNKL